LTEWHRENGYIRMHAIIAAYKMADYLHKRYWQRDDAWLLIEMGAELNALQFLKVGWELTEE